jgi:hypothetical protein
MGVGTGGEYDTGSSQKRALHDGKNKDHHVA